VSTPPLAECWTPGQEFQKTEPANPKLESGPLAPSKIEDDGVPVMHKGKSDSKPGHEDVGRRDTPTTPKDGSAEGRTSNAKPTGKSLGAFSTDKNNRGRGECLNSTRKRYWGGG